MTDDIYDFYKNPPKTKQDIRNYLTSWLQDTNDVSTLLIQGEIFIQEKGFRRGFHQHSVFRSLLTNQYVWWVYEDFDLEMFPQNRFSTYESMLEHVINNYFVMWKLDK